MAGSLREALETAMEQNEQAFAPAEVPAGSTAPIDKVDEAAISQSEVVGDRNNASAAAEDKARADRARDETGKFVKDDKPKTDVPKGPAAGAKAKAASSAVVPTSSSEMASQAPAAATATAAERYPTTWKKGLEQQWNLLPNEVRAEILRREGNFASGVSTYKQEWDKAKPYLDVVAPYRQVFEQYKVDPAQHISALLKTHHSLVTGSPQEKAAIAMQILQANNIPLEMLFVQGQDGKIYLNQNLQQARQAPQPAPQPDIDRLVDEKLSARESNRQIESFLADTATYPHGREVAPTMAQLLEANLPDVTDLPSAYKVALKMPAHSHLAEADDKLARENAAKAEAEAKRKAAEAARRNAVSPRSSAPTSVSSANSGKSSLRDTIAANVDAIGGGRV